MNVTLPIKFSILSPALRASRSNQNMLQKEVKSMKLYSVKYFLISGIKAGKTQNPDELKKLSKQVKDESFKHP